MMKEVYIITDDVVRYLVREKQVLFERKILIPARVFRWLKRIEEEDDEAQEYLAELDDAVQKNNSYRGE